MVSKDKKIIVTGVCGQLGSDTVNQLKNRGYKNVIGIDYEQLDITDNAKVYAYFKKNIPDIIIHCAAYTAVDKAEDEADKCSAVNALGTLNLAKVAQYTGAKIIYISTDYVFSGNKDGEYLPTDKKGALSVYGITKSAGEDFVKALCDKYFIVRTAWVFGKNGNNFIKTMLKLSQTRSELSVVADQYGSPTYTQDLAVLLADMCESDKYGIYHATNEGTCSWYDFACEIFAKAGRSVKVNAITTAEYPTKAVRPKNSRLSKQCLTDGGFNKLPAWQDALSRYLKEIDNV